MKTPERLARLENGWTEIQQAIKELTQATAANAKETDAKFRETVARFADLGQFINSLAHAVEAHDDQIGKLIEAAEKSHQEWEQLRREWQAYLTTIHPRQ
ncbi:MAG: hypothetical protein ABSB88_10495 [Bryobacteraceae bacterium]